MSPISDLGVSYKRCRLTALLCGYTSSEEPVLARKAWNNFHKLTSYRQISKPLSDQKLPHSAPQNKLLGPESSSTSYKCKKNKINKNKR